MQLKNSTETGKSEPSIAIIKDGKSPYTILLPENADECVRFAATELQDFMEKSTGVKLSIAYEPQTIQAPFFSLGLTKAYANLEEDFDFAKLNGDGFIIKTVGENVYLNGFRFRGILYAVYDFLEKFLGIRFIARDTTHIPKVEELYIPALDIIETPDFAMRGYLESSMYDGYEDFDFSQRLRAHHSFLFPDEKHGGRSKFWGRHNGHNFHYYVRPEIYNNPEDKEHYHPEFFFHGDGTYGEECNTTVCLANGLTDEGEIDQSMEISVAKIFIDELKKDVIDNPDIVYFNLDQEDGPYCCQCPKCLELEKKYMRSGMLIRMCNAVAKEVCGWAKQELNRDIYLVTFGYFYTANPPVKEENGKLLPLHPTTVASDKLIMRLAIDNDYRYSYFDERQKEKTRQKLKKWKTVANKFFGWIYEGFFDRYFLISPSLPTIKDNVVGFKNYGMEYLMVNGAYNTDGLWQDKLRAYLYNKLMWDSSLDDKVLFEEFMSLYFGEIGKGYVKKVVSVHYDYYAKAFPEKDQVMSLYALKDKDALPKHLLLSTLKWVEQARKETKESQLSDDEKKLYDKHLVEVSLAGLFPLVEHYFHYFPENTQEQYLEFAKHFVAECNYVNATRYHEHRTISFFVDRNYQFDY